MRTVSFITDYENVIKAEPVNKLLKGLGEMGIGVVYLVLMILGKYFII